MSEDIVAQVNKNINWGDYLFSRFVGERIRLPVTVEEKARCLYEPITTNKIKTIVTAWKKDAKVEINSSYVIERLTKMFGEPRDGCKWNILVFVTRGQVIDWDDEHPYP